MMKKLAWKHYIMHALARNIYDLGLHIKAKGGCRNAQSEAVEMCMGQNAGRTGITGVKIAIAGPGTTHSPSAAAKDMTRSGNPSFYTISARSQQNQDHSAASNEHVHNQ